MSRYPFALSFAIHLGLFGGGYLLVASVPKAEKEQEIILQFQSVKANSDTAESIQPPAAKEPPKPKPKPKPEKKPESKPEQKPVETPLTEKPLPKEPEPEPQPKEEPEEVVEKAEEPTVEEEEKPEEPAPVAQQEQLSSFQIDLSTIGAMLQDMIRYPKRALDRGYEGTVMVTLVLLPGGEIEAVDVKASSGYAMLDSAALKAVKRLAGRLPDPGERWEVTIPVSFVLNRG